MFPAIFVLKYKTQSAGSRDSEMVHNGSWFWNVVAMDYSGEQSALRYFDTHAIIRRRNTIGLIKRVY